MAREFEERGVRLLPIVVLAGEVPGGDRLASAVPLNDELEIVDAGPIDRCGIYYTPEAIAWFEQSDDDPAALRAISTLAAHELVHCFQFAVAGEARRARRTPDWVDEAAADWAAFMIVSPDSPAPSELSEWDEFFLPGLDLFGRDYDAVGFWSAVHRQGGESDAWQLLRFALALPWETSQSAGTVDQAVVIELSYAVLRRASGDPTFLARWAMSFLRRRQFGPEWDTIGPALGTSIRPRHPSFSWFPGPESCPPVMCAVSPTPTSKSRKTSRSFE